MAARASFPPRDDVTGHSNTVACYPLGQGRTVIGSFQHSDVFPIIARCIGRVPGDASGFASHDAIVAAILADPEGAKAVDYATRKSKIKGARQSASTMLQWFSKTITDGSNSWAVFFDREQRSGGWAYRPKAAVVAPITPDLDRSAVEGDPRLSLHIRRERDPALARAKREAMCRLDGHLMCEVCGFLAHRVYPGLSGDVCEIHHRLPLSEAAGTFTTRLEDLALLCPNCHRAIHQTDPLMSVEDFRAAFF